MENEIHLRRISTLNASLKSNEMGLQEIVSSCLERIKRNEPEIRAWSYVSPLEQHLSPKSLGPLSGLCLGVKDIFATIDGPTSMGTDKSTWRGTRGSFDARVVSKIRAAGGTIIGKNKTSEFAVHEPTDTINPRNSLLSPGTSSSGGAAAVAAGHISISIASQTAGSIARPASYCGVIGFKPSYGELPRTGVLKTTESFDTVGIIGNSVSNISEVFEVARVQDLNHPLHIKRAYESGSFTKVFYAIGPDFDDATPVTRAAAFSMVSSFMLQLDPRDIREISSLDFQELRRSHETIYAKELSYFLSDELDSPNISPGLKDFGRFGSKISLQDYRTHLQFLYSQRSIAELDLQNTLIIALSAADEAPPVGRSDLNDANLLWTSLGLPQISLPVLTSQFGNPLGLSLIGPRGSDKHLLEFAYRVFPNCIEHS
jgi:Asp-tRNA(Asn)/Glu-tRNA(Gln) amidotransferase A subunit family amidase